MIVLPVPQWTELTQESFQWLGRRGLHTVSMLFLHYSIAVGVPGDGQNDE